MTKWKYSRKELAKIILREIEHPQMEVTQSLSDIFRSFAVDIVATKDTILFDKVEKINNSDGLIEWSNRISTDDHNNGQVLRLIAQTNIEILKILETKL
jgi:hypothetical protein